MSFVCMVEENEVKKLGRLPGCLELGHKPTVWKNALTHFEWPIRSWGVQSIKEVIDPDQVLTFRCHPRVYHKIAWETSNKYRRATFRQFQEWLNLDDAQEAAVHPHPFHGLHPSRHWVYCDYKEICGILKPSVIEESLRWPQTMGNNMLQNMDSTLWVGSAGANTHLHYDSYSYNLIAQVDGKKKWTIFHPDDSNFLYPTRIPYEESSVFSAVNIHDPDDEAFPNFKKAQRSEIVLEPGDILFLPKHWWHAVECIEPSISINLWVGVDSDSKDRLKEALIRLAVTSLKSYQGDSIINWLNPTEVNASFQDAFAMVQTALSEIVTSTSVIITPNDIVNCFASDKIIDSVCDQLTQGIHCVSTRSLPSFSPKVEK